MPMCFLLYSLELRYCDLEEIGKSLNKLIPANAEATFVQSSKKLRILKTI